MKAMMTVFSTISSPKPNSAIFCRLFLMLLLCFMVGCRNDPPQQSDATQANSGQTDSGQTDIAQDESAPRVSPESANQAQDSGAPASVGATASTLTASSTPAGLVARAALLHKNGNYDESRSQLADFFRTFGEKDVAEQNALQQLFVEARFLEAKSYFVEEAYGKMLLVIDPLIDELSAAAPMRAKLLFLRAEAMRGLGRFDAAIDNYKEFEGAFPEAMQVTQELIAANFLALGNLQDAALAYQLAADAAEDDVTRVRMLEAQAQVYVATNQTDEAMVSYDQILSVARKPDYRAQILYTAGQTLAAVGDAEQAVVRWRAATAEAPENEFAYRSLIELVNREVEVDQFQRGYIDLEAGAYLPAIEAFETYLDESDPDDAQAGLAMHHLGQSYLGAGNYRTARQVFENVLNAYPNCSCSGEAWLGLAASHAWLGNGAEARRIYRTFAREQNDHELAPEALWRSGRLGLDEGSQLEVAVDFFALADSFPDSEQAPLALYIVGLGAYREGLTGQAVRVYERLRDVHSEYRPDAVGYWLGRSRLAAGDGEEAQAAWRGVVDEIPDTFHGVLSALALRNLDLPTNIMDDVAAVAGPASTVADDDGSQAVAEAWLATWFDDEGAASSKLPPVVDEDADLVLGRLMLSLDQRAVGLDALERAYNRYRDEPTYLYALSLEFERLDAYRLSLICMEHLLQLSPAKLVEDTPIFLQRYVYPRRYPDLVEQAGRTHNVDPLLFYSLIRQESLFERGARSYAAAQGLAQIIPDTAAWIAEQTAYPNFTNDLVYRPYINVDFGAFYLDWARGFLDDNMVSALVGYNAGPGNSREWRKISGSDDALFVEILSVNEPRLYILKITSNYYHYNRLYR